MRLNVDVVEDGADGCCASTRRRENQSFWKENGHVTWTRDYCSFAEIHETTAEDPRDNAAEGVVVVLDT